MLAMSVVLIIGDLVVPLHEDVITPRPSRRRRAEPYAGAMTAINLGMPAPPPPVLAPRRQTRQIKVGKVAVGGDAPVSVQSMTTTLTSDVNATLQQIAELTATGCDIVRVACPARTTRMRCPRSPSTRRSR